MVGLGNSSESLFVACEVDLMRMRLRLKIELPTNKVRNGPKSRNDTSTGIVAATSDDHLDEKSE